MRALQGSSRPLRAPACHWSFNRARRFHHISGDVAGFFDRPPAELLHRDVQFADEFPGAWTARLDRMFSRQTTLDHWTKPDSGHTLVHIPIRANDGTVTFVVGFGYRAGSPVPASKELDVAAHIVLQLLDTERTRAVRFLHDIVAQSLSGTGLQIELLKPEIQPGAPEAHERIASIQQSLEEVLKLIREFNPRP